jgi:hypothetical protein
MKLGGINVVHDPHNVPWLTDPPHHNHGYASYRIPHDYSRPYSSNQVAVAREKAKGGEPVAGRTWRTCAWYVLCPHRPTSYAN